MYHHLGGMTNLVKSKRLLLSSFDSSLTHSSNGFRILMIMMSNKIRNAIAGRIVLIIVKFNFLQWIIAGLWGVISWSAGNLFQMLVRPAIYGSFLHIMAITIYFWWDDDDDICLTFASDQCAHTLDIYSTSS
jgi:hypothetical protein